MNAHPEEEVLYARIVVNLDNLLLLHTWHAYFSTRHRFKFEKRDEHLNRESSSPHQRHKDA